MIMKYASASITPLNELVNSKDTIHKVAMRLQLDPDQYLYTVVSGIEGNIFNANQDLFPWSELQPLNINGKVAMRMGDVVYGWPTWIGKPVHKQHQPNLGKFGVIVDAYPRDKFKDVPMLLALDRESDPVLMNRVERGEHRDVSMGASCQYIRCSFCGRKIAAAPDDFCDHLRQSRGRWLTKQDGYEHNKYAVNGEFVKVGEVCYGVRGVEISLVHKGAFDSSKVLDVIKAASNDSEREIVPAKTPDLNSLRLAVQVLQDFLDSVS